MVKEGEVFIRDYKPQRTSLGYRLVCHFFFLPHFDVTCDLFLNRRMTTWKLFVKHAQLFDKENIDVNDVISCFSPPIENI